MNTVAEVVLWGRTIGAVYWMKEKGYGAFEYTAEFSKSGIQVAPIMMPLPTDGDTPIYTFPELSKDSFYGLPGLLADSLPDKYGHALIEVWLAQQGRKANEFNPVERLCYTGSRGMGALEYRPGIGPENEASAVIEIDQLVNLASDILNERNQFNTYLQDERAEAAMRDILHVGTSAGGARAKAVIAWNPETQEVRSGQVEAGEGFEYWMLKFDGVTGNADRELNDPQGYGAVEYAYYLMALAAGITMSESRLLEENGRRHFMTKRFDRTAIVNHKGKEVTEKLHMQTLAGLCHYDFNHAGGYSYEQALMVMRQLGMPMESLEQQFKRMVFNIIARNQDDHVKNIAFLMDKKGYWYLSPAYDLTYSYNPSGLWTGQHQMRLNGKRDDFELQDFIKCAKHVSMRRGLAESIVQEVTDVVDQWPYFAEQAGIAPEWSAEIKENHRLQIKR